MKVKALGVASANAPFAPLQIERREPKPDDVSIEIDYCGICHSDIHTARGEWGTPHYPCVPGHEIIGRVVSVGKKVKRFKLGEVVGVGCFVDSCGKCANCKANEEQLCEKHTSFTYDSTEADGKTPTYGGYSSRIIVKDKYVLKIKKNQPLDRVAPLLCAGITTYSPLKRFGTKKGSRVGVVGLGGLGHMAVKIAKAMGAEVTVFSTSPKKQTDSKKLGAKHFVVTSDEKNFKPYQGKLDLIIDTVSVDHNLSPYMKTLRLDGTLVLLGVPPKPHQIAATDVLYHRQRLTGSLIGGIKETQEMLDFCAKKKVFADIELISADQVAEAYDRTVKGDIKYRFVIDTKTI